MLKKWFLIGAAAAGSYALLPSAWGKLWRKAHRKKIAKTLFLTFDDGPSPKDTPVLLDLLKRYSIPATFFVVSDFARQYPDLIRRMRTEGHLIGFHSRAHDSAYLLTPKKARRDFAAGMDALQRMGVSVRYYRPPWGAVNLVSLREMRTRNLHKVLWDVMAQDWRGNITAAEIARRLRRRVFPGAVICLHDGRGTNWAPARTIQALETMLPKWLSQGYRFQTMEQYDAYA